MRSMRNKKCKCLVVLLLVSLCIHPDWDKNKQLYLSNTREIPKVCLERNIQSKCRVPALHYFVSETSLSSNMVHNRKCVCVCLFHFYNSKAWKCIPRTLHFRGVWKKAHRSVIVPEQLDRTGLIWLDSQFSSLHGCYHTGPLATNVLLFLSHFFCYFSGLICRLGICGFEYLWMPNLCLNSLRESGDFPCSSAARRYLFPA